VSAPIQLYGLRLISSGMAAVINSGLTPIFLLIVAVATRQERAGWRQVIAIAVGIAGLLLLFGPQAMVGRLEGWVALGIALVAFATVCNCIGNVLSRPLMRTIPPVHMAAMTNLIGGLVLLVLALPLEPGAWQAARLEWGWPAWLACCWLVFAGSTGASIIFFVLLRDWGASRAGSYSFVSPVVAVLLGMALMGEQLNAMEALGMTLMLAGAALGSSGRRRPART
jgi:drug/metabolite transporter (DMT)-like permease